MLFLNVVNKFDRETQNFDKLNSFILVYISELHILSLSWFISVEIQSWCYFKHFHYLLLIKFLFKFLFRPNEYIWLKRARGTHIGQFCSRTLQIWYRVYWKFKFIHPKSHDETWKRNFKHMIDLSQNAECIYWFGRSQANKNSIFNRNHFS